MEPNLTPGSPRLPSETTSHPEKESLAERERKLEEAFRERELAIKEEEIELKRQEARRSRWLNSVNVAIVSAALAFLGNSYLASQNSRAAADLEKAKQAQAASAAVELEKFKQAEAARIEERKARLASVDDVATAFRTCFKEAVDLTYRIEGDSSSEAFVKACEQLHDAAARLDANAKRWPQVAQLAAKMKEAESIYGAISNARSPGVNSDVRKFTLFKVRENLYMFDRQVQDALHLARQDPEPPK